MHLYYVSLTFLFPKLLVVSFHLIMERQFVLTEI